MECEMYEQCKCTMEPTMRYDARWIDARAEIDGANPSPRGAGCLNPTVNM